MEKTIEYNKTKMLIENLIFGVPAVVDFILNFNYNKYYDIAGG